MKNPQITKPTLSDYNKIHDFAICCNNLQHTLNMLNNHIEIIKRTGDVAQLRDLDHELCKFLASVVNKYKSTLTENEDKE